MITRSLQLLFSKQLWCVNFNKSSEITLSDRVAARQQFICTMKQVLSNLAFQNATTVVGN